MNTDNKCVLGFSCLNYKRTESLPGEQIFNGGLFAMQAVFSSFFLCGPQRLSAVKVFAFFFCFWRTLSEDSPQSNAEGRRGRNAEMFLCGAAALGSSVCICG